jgi:predicted regulator of Ras-like GTPase activity (Roadblock/LC7/MglB family)
MVSAQSLWPTDSQPPANGPGLESAAPTSLHRAARAACHAVLQRFVLSTPGVTAAVVASRGGAERCFVARQALASEPLAGLADALWASGSAMIEAAALGAGQHLVVESAAGAVTLVRVDDSDLLLATISDRNAMLSHVLWAARRCCDQLRPARPAP